QGVVVEGRDTGSVVFPRADHKFFLDANSTIRARRRQRELKKRYGSDVPLTQVQDQLDYRDHLDRTRQVGPLVKPKGAVAIDTTGRSALEVVRVMLRHITGQRRARP
ncbi:MAG: (d)CMP kinase, partial [Chloroflexota bacterium]